MDICVQRLIVISRYFNSYNNSNVARFSANKGRNSKISLHKNSANFFQTVQNDAAQPLPFPASNFMVNVLHIYSTAELLRIERPTSYPRQQSLHLQFSEKVRNLQILKNCNQRTFCNGSIPIFLWQTLDCRSI